MNFMSDQYFSIFLDNVNINKICRIRFKWGITKRARRRARKKCEFLEEDKIPQEQNFGTNLTKF